MMLWLCMTVLWAQEVVLQADGDIFVGMPFVLTVLAKDFDEDPTPEVLDFRIPNSTVDFLGVSPSVSTQMSYINGRRSVSKDVRFAFRYRVVPSRTGTFQIPSVQVQQGTVKAQSGNVQFEVREVAKSRDMMVELVLPQRAVRVGEVVPVYVDLYLRTNISDQSIMVPFFDLRENISLSAPMNNTQQTIAITTASGEVELPFERSQAKRNGREFTRIRLRADVTMIKSGNLQLEPARVVAQVPGGRKRDAFGFSSRSMRTVQSLDKKRIFVIEPLPLTGQPKSFAGAVGESFSIDVRAQRTVVKVGDPIELDITIRGKGEMAGLKLPDMYSAGLDKKKFDQPVESPIGELKEDGTKLFRTSVRLKSQSVAEIPALEFSYFDSKKGVYVTSRSMPIALSVEGSTVVSADSVVSNQDESKIGSQSEQAPIPISLTGANLKQSKSAEYKEQRTVLDMLPFVLFLYISPLIALFISWGREKTSDSRAARGASKTRKKAVRIALQNAEKNSLKESSAALRTAIKDISKHDGLECAEILEELEKESFSPTSAERLISKSLAGQIRSQLLVLLLLCIGGLYGTVAVAEEPEELYNIAMSVEDPQERIEAFERAAKEYRVFCERLPNSADAWVDWGNASLGARKYADAMVGYTRALQLDPQHERALQNQSWITQKLPDWVRGQDASTELLFWSTWYTLPELMFIGALLFVCVVVLQFPFARKLRFVQIIFALLWGSVMLSSLKLYAEPLKGVVMEEAGALRSTDNEGAPPVRSSWVPEGTPVRIHSVTSKWTEVILPNGDKGWLPKRAVVILNK